MASELLRERRERVFLVLAAVFLGAMTLLNVVGITRFIQLGPLALAVGVLPYPLTFLCTDLVSELYGRARATANSGKANIPAPIRDPPLAYVFAGPFVPGELSNIAATISHQMRSKKANSRYLKHRDN